jgi:DASH complex subunit ASK1
VSSALPTTPQTQTILDSLIGSSPVKPPSTARRRASTKGVLLHRVLDKNYRLQATPHTQNRLPKPGAQAAEPKTPVTGSRGPGRARLRAARGADLDSSPMLEAPQLRPELFASPERRQRVPGVSVLAAAKPIKENGGDQVGTFGAGAWDSDSDDDNGLPAGMSPPKTLQFHIPQSKLLKTPGETGPEPFLLFRC